MSQPEPENLVGRRVRVPSKSQPLRSWWVTVREQRGDFLKVAGNASAGKPWWTHRREVSQMSKLLCSTGNKFPVSEGSKSGEKPYVRDLCTARAMKMRNPASVIHKKGHSETQRNHENAT